MEEEGYFRLGGGKSYFNMDYLVMISRACFWWLAVQRLRMSLISFIGKEMPR